MPDWLKETQVEFTPNKKEAFLIKNQKGLLFLLRKFQKKEESAENPLRTIHPTVRLLTVFFLIILISLTRQVIVLWLIGLYLGGLLLLLDPVSLRLVCKKAGLLLVMPLVIYLPTLLFNQGSHLFLLRLPLLSITLANYTETTSVYELLVTLKRLHLPNVILLQLDITIKYIYLFGHLLLEMLQAVEARAVGGKIKLAVGSNLIGLIYLKAIAYGKQLDRAMTARCFTGEYYGVRQPLRKKDQLFVLAHSMLFIGLLWIGRI